MSKSETKPAGLFNVLLPPPVPLLLVLYYDNTYYACFTSIRAAASRHHYHCSCFVSVTWLTWMCCFFTYGKHPCLRFWYALSTRLCARYFHRNLFFYSLVPPFSPFAKHQILPPVMALLLHESQTSSSSSSRTTKTTTRMVKPTQAEWLHSSEYHICMHSKQPKQRRF